jgi:two-component system LytT family response regulator
MYKIVIVEDDVLAREMLSDLLITNHPGYTLTGFFDSVKTAVKSLPSLKPDLLFLDIELLDGKGFDILEKLDSINFEVIVTTGYDSYMLQAIKHSALDYVLKPVNAENLADALRRYELKIAESKIQLKTNESPSINKIILTTNEGLLFLNIADIIRLESDGAYTVFYSRDNKKYVTSRTLATYEDQLTNNAFFRVHHSHLINLNHISKYVKGEGGYVIMSDNTSVDVSRRKKEDFLKVLGQ